MPVRRLPLWGVIVLTGALVAACASSPSAGDSARTGRPPSTAAPTTATTAPPTTTTIEQPGWTPASIVAGAIAVDSRQVPLPDGSSVTLFRFRAPLVRFGLHVGSGDPPGAAAQAGPDSGPAIGPHESPVLLAAFNGGFKANAGVGGFLLDARVLLPLQPGAASLVVDTSGVAHVGIWGQDVPVPGEQISSVRQNLRPLVADGQPSPAVGSIGAWGSTLGGGAAVARSALGQDAAGNLVYAGTMRAVPADLAQALTGAGVVTAMQLDINPMWIQLAVAAAPGGPLAAGVPGQNRPADQYRRGWTRDFVTVTAAGVG